MDNQDRKGLSHKRGFASMTKERRSEIAKMGGIAAHAQGMAHEFSPSEAREAGLKAKENRKRAQGHLKST